MAAGRLLIPSWMPALDSDGDPISGVKAYFYVNLTTTLASVYADEALTIPITNPVEANSSGRFPAIWADGDVLYSVAIEAPYGPAGVPFSYDNLSASLGADIATAEAAEAAADDANAALAGVLAAIEAATEAGGGSAAVAGALAGQAAGTTAANAVVAGKADANFGNVLAATLQNFPLAADVVGSVAGSLGSLLGLSVAPELFGVVSGTVNDTVATNNVTRLKAALAAGYAVNGGGRTFAVLGEFRPTTAHTLKSITLSQQSLSTALEKTYLVDGIASGQITLEDVTIDERGLLKAGGMGQCSAIQISQCAAKVRLNRVTVINGGAITGIKLDQLSDVRVVGGGVRDFYPTFASIPSDDVCQAYSFGQCTNFFISDYDVRDMVAMYPLRASNAQQWSRGVVAGNCVGGFIGPGRVHNVDQGIDISGASNTDITVDGPLITDVGTHGVKAANTFLNITVQNCTILRAGADGIAVSAPGSTGVVQPSRVTLRNNTIKNTGSRGLLVPGSDAYGPRGPVGIKISGRDVAQPGYPEGVCMYGNRIIDDQTVKTMVWGIDCNQANVGLPDSAFPISTSRLMIQEWDNIIEGAIAGKQRGCQYHRASVAGTGSLSIPNNSWTPVPFTATDVDDTGALHDPAGANPSYFIVREDGTYSASAAFTHDNTATGVRGIRLRVNGGSAVYGSMQIGAQTTYSPQVATAPVTFALKSGDRVEVEVFQNSGGTVVNSLSNATFSIAMIQRGS